MPNVLLTSSTPARRQQFFAALVALIFILVATVLAAIVARAVQTITLTADAIDDSRATAAAEGALQSMRKQLGATITDNAYWDDAYQQVNASDTNVEWITETWASITADYPLYDTAIVVDGDNKVVVAYRDGQDMGAKLSDVFGSRIDRLLEAAHSVSKTDAIPVHFIRTERGRRTHRGGNNSTEHHRGGRGPKDIARSRIRKASHDCRPSRFVRDFRNCRANSR